MGGSACKQSSIIEGEKEPVICATADENNSANHFSNDFSNVAPPMPEHRQAEKEEAAAKEKEKEKLNKAREKKEREAKEKADRLAKEKVAKEARERAEREQKEREAQERKELVAKAGMPEGSKLEICLDKGWQPVSDEECKQIQNHLAGGETKFAISARGAMYVVDFTDPKNPTQANAMTGKARQLRVLK